MAVAWLEDVRSADLGTVGGKGASLGELTGAGLPVPPGFVVTAGTYRTFIEEAGIDEELFSAVDVDSEDSEALEAAHERAHELIVETEVPDKVRDEIVEAYRTMGNGEEFVAVRSSATAEDLPDASFAGQQETFLNVTEDDLVDRVQECWASLFSQRAIYYRNQKGFPHEEVDIAVVVQTMVDAEKSGVMFTSHPSTGDPRIIIEAAWGLGEAVVSGAVSPDNYVVDRNSGEVEQETVATKKVMHVKDEATGETIETDVPEEKRDERVLTQEEIDRLIELGRKVEDHYGEPQDVEWAVAGGEVFMLQSRPITTIDDDASGADESDETDDEESDEHLLSGLGASPGVASGAVRIVTKLDHLDQVQEGDVIVTEMTMPDMVPAMKRAAAIVTDEGGMTSHAAIVSRELGVPAVVGSGGATHTLEDGQVVTVDGEMGTVREGAVNVDSSASPGSDDDETPVGKRPKPVTATEVKVNVSIPEAASRAAKTGADGVGLLRLEHLVLSLDKTPERYIRDEGVEAYIEELMDGVQTVAEEFYPRPVRVRTIDAPTDEFRQLEGGEEEPHEHNPMLGYRGIRRSLDRPEVFEHELEAFKRLYDMGYENLEIMFPLVTDGDDVAAARGHMEAVGIDPDERDWGVMIETPASARGVDDIIAEGVDFVSFGTNDLTQYVLAVDRNNEHVSDRFDELHPAVLEMIGDAIDDCRAAGVDTSICGQAGSDPDMVDFLVRKGITSISANIDAVADVLDEVDKVEEQLILDSVR
ncbi:phosphoenolpyruvate synthase [Haloplanus vescus]|uniref:Phosphoenolpyruvate synthase n=1 Tax=Haloplanus vescus TaxID=555874 RepID=A0A1H3WX29_9EURY|nr:phosphoenolpyruvate synthase [Haloplanus vescus]SDZ90924.1 phosphoenolpyruvate synthase [Haloplanus vescus]